ncbi:MAG: nucleoside-diphosphate kinase [Chlamydiota bacterium]|nr:nucleoside-diphosphate kinase [Chlamydiota bacterium]
MFKTTILMSAIFLISLSVISCASPSQERTPTKETTLSIIKPDAVSGNHIGEIIQRFESKGLRVAAIKMVDIDKKMAGRFYEAHKERPFYNQLTEFMSSGPVVVMVLEGDNAILKNRSIMGATNPELAKRGTIRKDFASSISSNAVHGSDSPEAAKTEISFFFSDKEIKGRF